MTESILERVRQLAADTLAIPLDDVQPQSSPETIEAWDSMQHLNLLLELEGSFRLRFSSREIAGMTDIASIVRTITQKTGGQSRS